VPFVPGSFSTFAWTGWQWLGGCSPSDHPVPTLPSGSNYERSLRTLREEMAMSVLWWMIVAILWIALAFWPARVAGRKGHSFIGYFIFSLFLFPAAIITAYLIHDRSSYVPPRAAAVY
jgi:hypothetical protein